MKYMISCRHSRVELEQADEIKVNYNDIKRIEDFITEDWKCNADVYIYITDANQVDWDKLKVYKEILNIIIAAEHPEDFRTIRENGFKYFWSYPISTFYELRSLKEMQVCQVLLDAPLYFQLPEVKSVCGRDIEIRLIANKCFNDHLPQRTGMCGTYIRPEDIEAYSKYVSHIEFSTDGLEKEKALLKVYKEGFWPGNLNILLTNLRTNVDNRAFDNRFAERRISCGQRCQGAGHCHYCDITFGLINTVDRNRKYLDETYGPVD